jgi:acyl-homoserine lactone acylase PvdQ
MSPRVRSAVACAAALSLCALPASASAADYAQTALNIIPSGQYGSVPIPPGADEQAKLYDGLTPLSGNVTAGDLQTYFKSERFGVDTSGPARTEAVPRGGVTIVRDRFDVPHITGRTRDDVVWATGWVLAEDRGLLGEQARYNARIAALDAPNINAFSLVTGLKQFTPSKQAESIVDRQTDLLRRSARGRILLHEIDVYLQGINARLRAEKATVKPWTRIDVYAINALAGQIFGEGGGNEPRSAMLLDGLRRELGKAKGTQVWSDLKEQQDPEAPVTLDGRFDYEDAPSKTPGAVVIDDGSYKPVKEPGSAAPRVAPPHASNFVMVAGSRSTNGHPLFVAGPQIGYFYPGLTLEMDIKGPGFQARGATTAGFPGNILIGRGPDFAWSLSSAGSDLIDTYVETLCGGSTTRYRYKGKCRAMGTVDAGKIAGAGEVRYRTTVHGPVEGYARVAGRKVAISSKRASFGRDVEWQFAFREMSVNEVRSPQTFFKAMATSPFTFNAAYADDRDIAMYSTGRLPLRAEGVDPRLPTNGDGKYEWRGFLPPSKHPQAIGSKDGTLVNWNNKPVRGWGAADDQFTYGPLYRSQMLESGLASKPKHDLASVVSAMNRAATWDMRVAYAWPAVRQVLAGGPAPSPLAQSMVDLLDGYRNNGAVRLDLDGDGKVDDPGAAIIDAVWPNIAEAVMSPVLGKQTDAAFAFTGTEAGTGADFIGGGMAWVNKDLRDVLGQHVRGPFKTRFCGKGDLAACRASLWAAIDAAGAELAAQQGPDPTAWRADANAEKISFAPGLLSTKIRYTNRPSGIQQVISFSGHRPRR